MALEQAEQLFVAARSVDTASRPLLLFYGLSQAGRAIAACAQVPNDKFRLSGHGITTNDLDQPDLGTVKVVDYQSGAFKQVADVLGSRSLPDEVLLADLWSSIVEVALWPLSSCTKRLMAIDCRASPSAAIDTLGVMVSGMPNSLRVKDDPASTEAAIRAWLSDYPTLDGFDFQTPGAIALGGPSSWNDMRDTFGCDLLFQVSQQPGSAWEKFELIAPHVGRTLKPASTRNIHPRLPGDDRQLHPLLAWWSVLFALSMLARYNPDRWIAHIDVNQGKDAVAIEFLLEAALSAVPELILAAIDDIT